VKTFDTSKASLAVRVALPSAVVTMGWMYRDGYRRVEAGSASWLANNAGFDAVRNTGSERVLVTPERSPPFYAIVSLGCSSLMVLLAFVSVSLLTIRAPLHRRVIAASAAAAVLFAVNVVRVAAVAAIGAERGLPTMARAHDWFGTAVTLVGSVLAACALYVIAALPTREQRRRRRPWKEFSHA
jgi:exosortase/archaeosortase family protein